MNLGVSHQHDNRRLILLAPSRCTVPAAFSQAVPDDGRYGQLLAEAQRLRGAVYLEDGAITSDQLTPDGRYALAVDERSWHVLTLDERGGVKGCARYSLHASDVTFSQLGVASCSLAESPEWGGVFRTAVHGELALAKALRLGFAELGGWALSRDYRCTMEALRIALGMYGLANLLGDAICVSTATVRNCSASILQRLGGRPLQWAGISLPVYNDPKYNCDMEVLRFDSRHPADRFVHWIAGIRRQMVDIPVICQSSVGLQQADLRTGVIVRDRFRQAAYAGVTAA
jgi:hypothetical protein